MAFPTTSAQQAETNRKILEDIQTKKQLLAGGIINLGLSNTNQMPSPQLLGQPTAAPEFLPQGVGLPTNATPPRSAFNPTSSTTLGFFIPQDSYFGNSFIPVLPRLEPLPTTTAPATTTASHIAPK
ncbi:SOSS complex subunit C homolog [Drosophila miranda]|uniref:SOSS complex subunit C homolog n=1 Tax=Drosophila miranda TaxID=7229 RepID=UPI0007E62328|nr:SOSS complex subunit C homolog [Drosophila miranda]XP_033255260.1 SOSS complex subunit C homolog [Drosophila miranda]XP_033255286.1 SOSS complex subunit C homolog [Drosophila miranda]